MVLATTVRTDSHVSQKKGEKMSKRCKYNLGIECNKIENDCIHALQPNPWGRLYCQPVVQIIYSVEQYKNQKMPRFVPRETLEKGIQK